MAQNVVVNEVVATADSLALSMGYGSATADFMPIFDQTNPGLFSDRTASDTSSVTDAITAGLAKDKFIQDSILVTDSEANSMVIQSSQTDTLDLSDMIFPWTNGNMAVTILGVATFNAMFILRNALATPPVVVAPSKTTALPKPPLQIISHPVVNASPPRHQE